MHIYFQVSWTSKMGSMVKAHVTKPNNLSLTPATHMVKERGIPCCLLISTFTHAHTCKHLHTYTSMMEPSDDNWMESLLFFLHCRLKFRSLCLCSKDLYQLSHRTGFEFYLFCFCLCMMHICGIQVQRFEMILFLHCGLQGLDSGYKVCMVKTSIH